MVTDKKDAAFIFAAGKSSRMGTGISKMREEVTRDGDKKPMLMHTVDIFKKMGLDVYILIGFDGTEVSKAVGNAISKAIRVSKDDGSDLPPATAPTTAGSLKKVSNDIIQIMTGYDNIILSVGDQPFMRLETLKDFLERHKSSKKDASILLANIRNTPLEQSTSTRVVAISSDAMVFFTPPKEGPFDGLSTLADVGVMAINKQAFEYGVSKLDEKNVFGTIMCCLSEGGFTIGKVDAQDPYQFMNVNEKKDKTLDIPSTILPVHEADDTFEFVDNSKILLDWLEWHVLKNRSTNYSIFNYPKIYRPEFEMDTTLFCRGTPACKHDCTYRNKHLLRCLDLKKAEYIIERSKHLGFKGILFSGGGENLEPEAYNNFLQIARFAKENGFSINLATNGVNLDPIRIAELAQLLDSIRFSIPPKTSHQTAYSHVGTIANQIHQMHKYIQTNFLETRIYANVLMTPLMEMSELESTVLLLSQLGVDTIRFKATHESIDGKFIIRPQQYKKHIRLLKIIENDPAYHLPKLTISKLEEMTTEPFGPFPFDACYYRDFNPLVVGCDGHNYSCCELKYEAAPFDLGEILNTSDNLEMLTRAQVRPQVITSRCFRGCKGYLINKDLQILINEYRVLGDTLFTRKQDNAKIRDKVVSRLARTVISN